MVQLLFAQAGLQNPRTAPAAVIGALLLTATLAGCGRRDATQPATTPAASTPASGGIAGVVPQSESTLPASDRPTAPATGAVEAGQAGGRGSNGGAAAPTGGDGAASAGSTAPSGSPSSPGAPASASR